MKLVSVIGCVICVFLADSSVEMSVFLAAMFICMAMPERTPTPPQERE